MELTEKLWENSRTSLIKCPMVSDAEMEVRIKTLQDMNIILCVKPLVEAVCGDAAECGNARH